MIPAGVQRARPRPIGTYRTQRPRGHRQPCRLARLWLAYSPLDQGNEMAQRERVVRRVKRLHVPLVNKPARQLEPRLFSELIPWVRLSRRDFLPVPSGKLGVVTHDLNDIWPNMRFEQRSRDRSVAGVAEHLADVVQQPGEHDVLVGTGAFRPAGQLEGVVELAHCSAVTHALKAGEECQHLFGPPSGATEPVHTRMLA